MEMMILKEEEEETETMSYMGKVEEERPDGSSLKQKSTRTAGV